jgi:hypothetical protein
MTRAQELGAILFVFIVLITQSHAFEREVDKKYCVSECRKTEFKLFHSKGSSWGAGSSSMNGMSQSAIYTEVTKSCEEFYKTEKCCEWNRGYSTDNNIRTIHGFDYGVCIK